MSKLPSRAAFLAGGALAGAAGFAAYAAACPRTRVWAPGFHRGPRHGRTLALTFDDGPSNETPRFLDLLAERDIQATFFVCGANVARRSALARRLVDAGHEIANHTYNHPCLLGLSARRVYDEVATAQRAIEDATGVSPVSFRPPYGIRSPALRPVLEELGLLAVHWTVIGKDWKWPANRIAARVLEGAGPGGILCLHDGDRTRPTADRGETLDALRQALPLLLRRGYSFATAREMAAMLNLRPVSP
jgi:peptidoglycan/xylan/chitin deacetylase (PgdA/CDA1 family)